MRNRQVLAFFHFTEVFGTDVCYIDGLQTRDLHTSMPSVDFQAFFPPSPHSSPSLDFFLQFLREMFCGIFVMWRTKKSMDWWILLLEILNFVPFYLFFFAGAIFVPESSVSESGLSGLYRSTQCFGGWEGCCLWVSVTLCSDTLSDLVHAWLVSTTWGEEYTHVNTPTDTHLPFKTVRPVRAVGNQCCASLPVRGEV